MFLIFTPTWGRWTQFDSYLSDGLVQPPTRPRCWSLWSFEVNQAVTQLGGHNQIQPLEGSPPQPHHLKKVTRWIAKVSKFWSPQHVYRSSTILAMNIGHQHVERYDVVFYSTRSTIVVYVGGELGNGGNASWCVCVTSTYFLLFQNPNPLLRDWNWRNPILRIPHE